MNLGCFLYDYLKKEAPDSFSIASFSIYKQSTSFFHSCKNPIFLVKSIRVFLLSRTLLNYALYSLEPLSNLTKSEI